MIYQDNQSEMLLEKHGKGSSFPMILFYWLKFPLCRNSCQEIGYLDLFHVLSEMPAFLLIYFVLGLVLSIRVIVRTLTLSSTIYNCFSVKLSNALFYYYFNQT